MRYLLSRASRPILRRLARERTLCAFDFDGTLAPIVKHPDQARLSDVTRSLLSRLAAVYPCVILSGRARPDLVGKLGGVSAEQVIGNHGAEAEGTTARTRQVRKWKAPSSLSLAQCRGSGWKTRVSPWPFITASPLEKAKSGAGFCGLLRIWNGFMCSEASKWSTLCLTAPPRKERP
ncbi:MAG: hypothetical protein FJW37_11315 [Acidobacteria bacterium]|nr:hypothetical protein [Acidobacteriota bacterium]